MSTYFEHPGLNTPVTAEQREHAERRVQEAYADGRITAEEFETRIGQVLSAGSRRDLDGALDGLVRPRPFSQPWSGYPTGMDHRPAANPVRAESTAMGAVAHFSGLFTWILGPGAVYLLAGPGTRTRREAAKAFNFQLVAGLIGIAGAILAAVAPWDILHFLNPLLFVGWLVLTVVGGAKAAQGADWRNPVKSVVKLDVLPER